MSEPRDTGVGRRLRLWLIPIGIAFVTAGLIVLWFQQTGAARQQVFETLVDKIAGQVRSELDGLFKPVNQALERIRLRGREGGVPLDDVAALNIVFVPLLETAPKVSGAIVADETGRQYFLTREIDGWRTTSRLSPGSRDGEVRIQIWNTARDPAAEWTRTSDYDPRERPWFVGGGTSGLDGVPHWTAPYIFASSGEPGITAAVAWRAPETEIVTVAALDLRLDDLARALATIAVADRGMAFMVTGDGSILGIPTQASDDVAASPHSGLAELTTLTRFPQVAASHAQWRATGGSETPFRTEPGDTEPWWASYQPYQIGDRTIWIGMVIPEGDLVDRSGGGNLVIPIMIGAAGLLACGAAIWLLRRVPSPTGTLVQSGGAHSPEDVRQLIASGESETLEFKSTIRWNLHSGKPGKEIEFAWLKTVVAFLNSKGGTILLGVADDGSILGTAEDNLEPDDKCLRYIDNIINQHVGPAFLPFITVGLVPIESTRIVQVRVMPADKPAFLDTGKSEDFYIRSGPGSRKLATSRVLEYVASRRPQT